MTVSRRLRLLAASAVLVALGAGRVLEIRRLAVPLSRDGAATHPTRLNTEQMLLDLQILSSDRFGGRATDTPGGLLAGELVRARFDGLGLSRFGDRFEQPFSFVHRSIRALWRRHRPFSKTFTDARNIIGFVPGTAAQSDFIVLSAHFDHLGVVGGERYPGADDNASGTSALLAIAAYVTAHPLAHSVVFAAFDAEELGLRGSRAFLQALPFPAEQLRLNLNMDMIGRSDGRRLVVSGVREHPTLRAAVERAARTATIPIHIGHDRSMFVTGLMPDWRRGSDHSSFRDAGVPYLYFGVEDHADTHTPTDDSSRIDGAFFAGAAEAVLTTLIEADQL